MMRKITLSFFASFFLLVTIYAQNEKQSYFPGKNNWESKSPESLGVNKTKLQEAIDFAQANEYSGSRDLRIAILKGFSHEPFHYLAGRTKKRGGPAGVILKNGFIIAQWGDVERVDMTFSVTKSYLSTVCGLAVDEGLIPSVDDKVGKAIWDGTFDGNHNSKITWRHLLTQSSDWTGNLFGMKDWADRPPKEGGVDDWKIRKFHEPGTNFEYNDVRVNVLSYSLLQTWRQPLPKILKEKIMDPIGATPTWRWFGYKHSFVNVDGIQMQSVSGGGHSGGGVFINTLDHARFGLLFLRKGKWNNQQLISEKWVNSVHQPSTANANYGFMWWINKKGSRRHWEGVSESIYYAAGFGGNYIVIDEENDVVIVTRWLEPKQMGEFMKKVMTAF